MTVFLLGALSVSVGSPKEDIFQVFCFCFVFLKRQQVDETSLGVPDIFIEEINIKLDLIEIRKN